MAEKTAATKQAEEQAETVEAVKAGAGAPEGIVIKAGDPVKVPTEAGVAGDANVVVGATVWQEFFSENSLRPSHRLLFTKGQTVLQSVLDRHDEVSRNAPRPE